METSSTSLEATPEDLFTRYRGRGDVKALGTLFDLLSPELFRMALALLPDAASAEDALQETWLTALERAEGFDAERRVTPWLVGILRHKVQEVRRRVRRTPDPTRLATREAAERPATPEDTEEVDAEIDALPEPYRAVALMRWRYGLEPAEIAHIRDEAPGTTRSLLSRARARLRRVLRAVPALFVGGRPPRGLASVREAVLHSARGAAAASAATAALVGGVVVKKVLLGGAIAAAVLLLAGVGWHYVGPDRDESRGGTGESGPLPTEEARLAGRSSADAASAPAGDPGPGTGPAPSSALVRGRVVDTSGRAIPEAQVEILKGWRDDDAAASRAQVTAQDGSFAFDGATAGAPYRIRAWVHGYTRESKRTHGGAGPQRLILWRAGAIAGRVLNASDGSPVANAEIHLNTASFRMGLWQHTAPQLAGMTRTDDTGAYELTGVPVGTVYLGVQPVTHAATTARIEVRAGAASRRDFYVSQGARIEGRVLLDGNPAAGIRVWAIDRLLRTVEDVSDASGRYQLGGLVPTRWHVRAHDAAVGFAGSVVDLAPGTTIVERDLPLRRAATLRGRVLLDGEPVAGAWVGTDAAESQEKGVRTDATGRYELTTTGWGASKDDLYAHLEGVGFGEIEVVLGDPVAGDWDIELSRFARVEGRVRAADGSRLEDVAVHAEGPGPFWVLRTSVLEDGRFEVRAAPGEWHLEVDATGWPLSPLIIVDLAEGETKQDVELLLPAGASLRGRVVDDEGRPVPRIFVEASHGRTQHFPLSAVTDDEGRYAFHGLEGPSVQLQVPAPEGFAPLSWRPARLDGGDVDLVLRHTRQVVRGRVVHADGRPCRSCEVLVLVESQADGTPLAHPYALDPLPVSDAEGRFTIVPLSHDRQLRMRVLARTRDAVSRAVAGVAASAEPAPDLVLRLEPASWMRGMVRDAAGEPIPGIELYHAGVPSTGSPLKVDDRGRFVVGPVPAGEHEVILEPWGYVRHAFSHRAEAGRDLEIEVVLHRGGDVRLHVLGAAGDPLGGATVEFRDASGAVIPIDRRTNRNNPDPHVPRERQTTSDTDGLVHRQWLPPGPCRAHVTRDGYETLEFDLKVEDESVIEAEVRLKPNEE